MATFKFPFKDQTGNEVQDADVYYDALTLASSGYYPLGPTGVHCGIHYEQAMANTLALAEGIRTIAKGEVVAYRVNQSYLSVPGRANPPMSDNALYSSGFVLTRHFLEYPAGNKLTYFCLAMHLRSFEEYERLGTRTQRPPYWTSKTYRVSQKANDKQEVTPGSAAPVIQGTRVRAKPSAGTTPVLGILPRGTRIIGGEIDKGWVRIRSVIEGKVAPPKTGDAPEAGSVNGWVHQSELEAQSQVPDAFDEVVIPAPPIKVKAGTLLGHLGEYRRIADPGSSRQMLHHEIIAGADLPAYLEKSRAAAQAAKPEEKTVLRLAPEAQLRNAVLASAQSGVLHRGTVVELDGTPPDGAVYVKVKPVKQLQWIDRQPTLPAGASEAKLYRYTDTSSYAAADIVEENNRGTYGQPSATKFRGILVAASTTTPVWIAASTYRGLSSRGSMNKAQKLVLSDLDGWTSYPLTFSANGYKNGGIPHHFATSTLELARPTTPDPTAEPIGFALDEAGKRWWQVQVKDGTTIATGWAGEAGHPGVSLHSPHEWVDFSIIESQSQTTAYGSYFVAVADMAAFHRGEIPLRKSQLDAPLRPVFDTLDTHPDGALTLGELQAAQRNRSMLQRLSRFILRYPTEWKADPEAWKQYDAEVPPSAKAAWESERQRMQKLAWWDDAKARIEGLPAAEHASHIHPVAFSGNFSALKTQCEHCGADLTITPQLLRRIFNDVSEEDSKKYSKELNGVFEKYEINTCLRVSHFFGQCEVECGGFTTFRESLYYPDGDRLWRMYKSAITSGLTRTHPTWTSAQMEQYTKSVLVRNDAELGKVLFGDSQYPNNDYRGRGLLHLTWLENYAAYKKFSGNDVTKTPSLVENDAHIAADSSGWFWATRRINESADKNNPVPVTKPISPALVDIDRRRSATRKAFLAINQGREPCKKNWDSTLNSGHGW